MLSAKQWTHKKAAPKARSQKNKQIRRPTWSPTQKAKEPSIV